MPFLRARWTTKWQSKSIRHAILQTLQRSEVKNLVPGISAKAEKKELYTCKNAGNKAIKFNPEMSEHHQGIVLSRQIAVSVKRGANQVLLWQ
jgi:uncharacterized protein (DUF305 family)